MMSIGQRSILEGVPTEGANLSNLAGVPSAPPGWETEALCVVPNDRGTRILEIDSDEGAAPG